MQKLIDFVEKTFRFLIKYISRISWFKESNRAAHFVYAIPAGFMLTILFVFGLALGMEYKDKAKGGLFDVEDILATMLGGLLGQIVQILIIYFLWDKF